MQMRPAVYLYGLQRVCEVSMPAGVFEVVLGFVFPFLTRLSQFSKFTQAGTMPIISLRHARWAHYTPECHQQQRRGFQTPVFELVAVTANSRHQLFATAAWRHLIGQQSFILKHKKASGQSRSSHVLIVAFSCGFLRMEGFAGGAFRREWQQAFSNCLRKVATFPARVFCSDAKIRTKRDSIVSGSGVGVAIVCSLGHRPAY